MRGALFGLIIVALSTDSVRAGPFDFIKDAIDDAKRAVETALDQAGRATGTALDQAGRATETALDQAGRATETALDQTGRATETALDQTGRAAETALDQTGRATETALDQTGRALEKAGADALKLVDRLVDFNLDCDVAIPLPAKIDVNYQSQCSGRLDDAKDSMKQCYAMGGVSISAMGGSFALAETIGSVATFGMSYIVAKAAFETCQSACRATARLNQCIASVDSGAADASAAVRAARVANDLLEERGRCIREGILAEIDLFADSLLAACEKSVECSTSSEEFRLDFDRKIKNKQDIAADRLDQSNASLLNRANVELDYGPNVSNHRISELRLTYQDQKELVCHAREPNVKLRVKTDEASPSLYRIVWRTDNIVVSSETQSSFGRILESKADLSYRDPGVWDVSVIDESNSVVGTYRFVYRLE